MTHTRTALVIVIVTITATLVPRAEAYVTPEQVLEQTEFRSSAFTEEPEYGAEIEEESATEENLPSGIRPRKPVSPYRVQQSKGPHMMLRKDSAAPAALEEGEETEEAVLEVPENREATGTDASAVIRIDAKTARILERLSQPKAQVLTIQAAVRPLHAGAPLAPTGPATIAAMGAMLTAIYGTVRRAGKMRAIVKHAGASPRASP